MVPCTEVRDLVELGVEDTPQYDPYKNKLHNVKTFPNSDKEPEVTAEWGDQYVNAEILLPRGDKMTQGWVVCQKHDANGNPIGRSKKNPILDTCLYEVEFPRVEMTQLAVNIIAESMYAQCNVDGNEYIWFKGEKPLVSQQLVGKFVANGKMDPYYRRSYPILRNCIQLRLLNMP